MESESETEVLAEELLIVALIGETRVPEPIEQQRGSRTLAQVQADRYEELNIPWDSEVVSLRPSDLQRSSPWYITPTKSLRSKGFLQGYEYNGESETRCHSILQFDKWRNARRNTYRTCLSNHTEAHELVNLELVNLIDSSLVLSGKGKFPLILSELDNSGSPGLPFIRR